MCLGTFCRCWFGQQKQKWSIIWGTGIFKALKSAAALLMAIDPDTDVSYGGFNYSKSAVRVLLRRSEWKLCAAFPSGGVPVLRVSKHPLDVEPSEGEQGAQCLPTPSALSWMRLPSWFLAPNLT